MKSKNFATYIGSGVITVLLLILIASCSTNNSSPKSTSKVMAFTPRAELRKDINVSYVYMTLKNLNDKAITLTGVRSSSAAGATLRRSVFSQANTPNSEAADVIEIPPKGTLELGRTSYFVMLENLNANVRPGQNVNVILEFDNNEFLSVNAVVQYTGFRLQN